MRLRGVLEIRGDEGLVVLPVRLRVGETVLVDEPAELLEGQGEAAGGVAEGAVLVVDGTVC